MLSVFLSALLLIGAFLLGVAVGVFLLGAAARKLLSDGYTFDKQGHLIDPQKGGEDAS